MSNRNELNNGMDLDDLDLDDGDREQLVRAASAAAINEFLYQISLGYARKVAFERAVGIGYSMPYRAQVDAASAVENYEPRRNDEKTEVAVTFKRETGRAVLVNDGGKDIWLPKSQIEIEGGEFPEEGEPSERLVAEWLAKEKGLI